LNPLGVLPIRMRRADASQLAHGLPIGLDDRIEPARHTRTAANFLTGQDRLRADFQDDHRNVGDREAPGSNPMMDHSGASDSSGSTSWDLTPKSAVVCPVEVINSIS
jgi:hypothetical protein